MFCGHVDGFLFIYAHKWIKIVDFRRKVGIIGKIYIVYAQWVENCAATSQDTLLSAAAFALYIFARNGLFVSKLPTAGSGSPVHGSLHTRKFQFDGIKSV